MKVSRVCIAVVFQRVVIVISHTVIEHAGVGGARGGDIPSDRGSFDYNNFVRPFPS